MFLCKEHREGWRLGNVKGVHILFLKAVFWLLCIRFALLFFQCRLRCGLALVFHYKLIIFSKLGINEI